jgi:8-oxo-dGTP pyrophosphatase MutT (NUDIX family)
VSIIGSNYSQENRNNRTAEKSEGQETPTLPAGGPVFISAETLPLHVRDRPVCHARLSRVPPYLDTLKRRLFWVVSRVCFAAYHYFPVFGTLRASVGIIRREGKFLIIHRNDGRGLSLPGGISGWREAPEETLRREIAEETGLSVSAQELKVEYYSDAEVPCYLSVFEVTANGEPKDSWEGSPRWTTVAELETNMLPSQRPLLRLLRSMTNASSGQNE